MSKEIRYNFGCGESRLTGYINIDCNKHLKPDLVLDLRYKNWPLKDGTADSIVCFHTLEHISKRFHGNILYQFNRLLKPNGELLLSFPDFETCVMNYLENKQGKKEFWEATIYGRQLDDADFHVCALSGPEMSKMLRNYGFSVKYCGFESDQTTKANHLCPFNVLIKAVKTSKTQLREDLVRVESCTTELV